MKKIEHNPPTGNGIVFILTGYTSHEARAKLHATGMHIRRDPKEVTSGVTEIEVAEKGTATIAKTIEELGSTLR